MFRTHLLSIIRSLNNVFTATGICHTSYVDCLLARSRWSINVAKVVIAVDNRMASIAVAVVVIVVVVVVVVVVYLVSTSFLIGSHVYFSCIR